MDPIIMNLRVRVVKTLKKRGPLTFLDLRKTLRIRPEFGEDGRITGRAKRLDNVLQGLRSTGQIFYTGHAFGWKVGRGPVFR